MKRNRWLIAGLGITISLFFLWIAFRDLKPLEVWTSIQQADKAPLIFGACVYFIAVTIISLRWQFLLRAFTYVPLAKLVPLVAIGYAGNNIYPFRSGEILRILLLQRNHAVAVASATTTVIVERVFDGLVMLTFIVVSLLFLNISSPEVRMVANFTAPLFITALIIFFILAARPNILRRLRRFLPERLNTRFFSLTEDIITGLEALRSPLDLIGAIVSSYTTWAVEASVYWIVSFAFQFEVSYPTMLLVVGVVNLAGLIPASPGQFGVFEFFVASVLLAAGVAEVDAHAYALTIHMVIWLPVTLVGLFFLARQGLGLGAIARAQRLETNAT